MQIHVHRTPAVMIALIAAGAFSVQAGNGREISYQTINFTELTGRIIKNPGIGYQTFYRSAASDSQFPSSVLYTRVNWSQIEPAPGTYDFAPIDKALSQAQSAGQRLAFRIMGFHEGDSGPVGLKKGGYPGYTFTFKGHPSVWFPDMNQDIVQQDLAHLIAALGQRYGKNPSIDSIDIGFVGDWGEFHFWNTNPTPCTILPTV
jgi:Beta-galactosidase